ncbi:hypothetical protein P8C59_002858 [Phyllachora maydis]|uniref:Uncharacterized protein n=1 Tax=Phyllachora maydis TaxID=1825666 RepID=A0AAD9I0K4_9PEZI|nr:hypothetical protein P8C59_002858 [Phyllachora maydis]
MAGHDTGPPSESTRPAAGFSPPTRPDADATPPPRVPSRSIRRSSLSSGIAVRITARHRFSLFPPVARARAVTCDEPCVFVFPAPPHTGAPRRPTASAERADDAGQQQQQQQQQEQHPGENTRDGPLLCFAGLRTRHSGRAPAPAPPPLPEVATQLGEQRHPGKPGAYISRTTRPWVPPAELTAPLEKEHGDRRNRSSCLPSVPDRLEGWPGSGKRAPDGRRSTISCTPSVAERPEALLGLGMRPLAHPDRGVATLVESVYGSC